MEQSCTAKTAAKVMKNSETHSVHGSQNGLNYFRLRKKGNIPGKLQTIVSVTVTWQLCFVQKAALEEVFRFFFSFRWCDHIFRKYEYSCWMDLISFSTQKTTCEVQGQNSEYYRRKHNVVILSQNMLTIHLTKERDPSRKRLDEHWSGQTKGRGIRCVACSCDVVVFREVPQLSTSLRNLFLLLLLHLVYFCSSISRLTSAT